MNLHLAPGQYWLDLLPLALALFIMPLISILSGRQIDRALQAALIPRYLQTMLRGWLMVALLCAIWWRMGRPVASLGLDWPVGRLGQFGLLFDAVTIVALAIQFFRLGGQLNAERVERLRRQMARVRILPRNYLELFVFMLLSLTAGVWEELIYRGFLFWVLAPYMGLAAIILVSALVFAAGHAYQGPRGVLFSGALGVVFGTGFALSHSLWWLMIAHAIIDVNGGLIAFRVMRMSAFRSGERGTKATSGNHPA